MLVRSKAPLRLGLAGGGTDVSPYSDDFGGSVLNATIDMFAYCTLERLTGNQVEFVALDIDKREALPLHAELPLDNGLKLHRAIHNRIVRDYCGGVTFPVRVTTHSDAPPGSGLGSSSTLVVAILTAYAELLNLPLGEYDIARLAFDIERRDCNLSGGKQDQYAATFGGFNFMEFRGENTIINPLRVRPHITEELHARMLLYFTGVSRESARIIDDQIASVKTEKSGSVEAMHALKQLAFDMKERLLKGDVDGVAGLFRQSWDAKKAMSTSISNAGIDRVAEAAMAAGAQAVKVSGAGGGGFMMIFADPVKRLMVRDAVLAAGGGTVTRFNFEPEGARAWTVGG